MQEPPPTPSLPRAECSCVLAPSLADNWRKGAYVFAAFINEKGYFKQYSPTCSSCLLEGVEVDWHAPGAFPGTGRGPTLRGVPGQGQAGRIVMTPCTCPSLPWKPLESTRRADGPPLPELVEQPLVSDSKDRETKCLCPPPSPSLCQPLAARPGPASWQAYQSLAEGPCHLWLPDKLDVTCVFWPLQEPRCCEE